RQLPQRVADAKHLPRLLPWIAGPAVSRAGADIAGGFLANFVDGRVVPGLFHQVEHLLMRPAYSVLHGFGGAVGFGPDDFGAEDEAELVGAGERVPPRQPKQRLRRPRMLVPRPRNACAVAPS